jgi:DNA-binding XRE family transcriptional regulator
MGVTQQGLADLLEVSRNTIKAWERNDPKRRPHILTQEGVYGRLTKLLPKATT